MKLELLTLLLAVPGILCSQDIQAPVAPNVASMGEFGDYPIGYHTGTPIIEFPLYQINLDGLIIPINLKYNSSGIRIDQNAGWVGLGWSLETGGHITKEIRGLNDFINQSLQNGSQGSVAGYYYTQEYLYSMYVRRIYNAYTQQKGDPDTGELEGDILSGEMEFLSSEDNEPDLYHFNFCNYSGTFYFEPRKAGDPQSDFIKPVIKSSNQYLDITYNLKNPAFTIVDQQGFKFNFIDREYADVYSEQTEYQTGKNRIFSTDKQSLSRKAIGAFTETSWQLGSIESPRGKKIFFTYNTECSSTPLLTSRYWDIPIKMEVAHGLTIMNGDINKYNYTYSAIRQMLPQTISFDGGSISFDTSDRKDVDSYVSVASQVRPNNGEAFLSPQKLDKITIKNQSGENIKDIKFAYSCMGNPTDCNSSRLMLNSFETMNVTQSENQLFKFTYKEGTLPAKNSYNSDIWGYYNGTVNEKDTPTYTDLKTEPNRKNTGGYAESYIYKGADRSVNEKYTQFGILDMIEYPTGGKTRFIYESHDFKNGFSCGFTKKYLSNSFVTYNPDNIPQQESPYTYGRDFILEEDSYVELTYHYHPYSSSEKLIPSVGYVCFQEKHSDSYTTFYSKLISLDQETETMELSTDAIFLKKGTYRIYLWRDSKDQNGRNKPFNFYVTADATAFIPCSVIKRGGGLRIKEIQNLDNGKIVGRKQYSYTENGYSSGRLLSIPDYTFLLMLDETLIMTNYYRGLLENMRKFLYVPGVYIPTYGVPFIPCNDAAAQVVYNYVEEKSINEDNVAIGKTVYKYMAEPLDIRIPFPVPKDYHLGNGYLLEESHYDREGYLQKKKILNYSFKPIPGASTLQVPKIYSPEYKARVGVRFYEVKPEFWSPDVAIETDYSDHGRNSVSKRTEYSYDMNNRLVNKQTMSFGSTSLVTRTRYAKDFSDATAMKMKEKNMIGIPLETVTLKNGKIISGSKPQYVFNSGLDAILKKGAYTLKQIPSLSLTDNYSQYFEGDYMVSSYDDSGNPVEIINKDGTHDIYLWSYNGQYMVAEIKNSTYAAVNAALSTVGLTSITSLSANANPDKLKLDKLRLQAALSNAFITTYQYLPLIGVTQMTDVSGVTTYYEYDAFGRLIRTKNTYNRMIQENGYHYRNQ